MKTVEALNQIPFETELQPGATNLLLAISKTRIEIFRRK